MHVCACDNTGNNKLIIIMYLLDGHVVIGQITYHLQLLLKYSGIKYVKYGKKQLFSTPPSGQNYSGTKYVKYGKNNYCFRLLLWSKLFWDFNYFFVFWTFFLLCKDSCGMSLILRGDFFFLSFLLFIILWTYDLIFPVHSAQG